MADYMLLLYAPDGDEAEQARRWGELPLWDEVTQSLRDAGLLVANSPLYGPETATTVRVRAGDTELTDGAVCGHQGGARRLLHPALRRSRPGDGGRRAAADRPLRLDRGAADHGHERHARARRGRIRAGVSPHGQPLRSDDAIVQAFRDELMLLHDARRSARVDSDGGYVELAAQDRTLWDRGLIAEGLGILERAFRLGPPGEYQLQAAITAAHIEAPRCRVD